MLEFLKDLNLSEEQLKQVQELISKAGDNPMEALGMLQQILPADAIQQLMMKVMQNPGALLDMAKNIGISDEQISSIKDLMGK